MRQGTKGENERETQRDKQTKNERKIERDTGDYG
jgi:hypothetical protein